MRNKFLRNLRHLWHISIRKEIMCYFNLLIAFILTSLNLPKGRLKIRNQISSRALSPSLEGLGRSKCEGKK